MSLSLVLLPPVPPSFMLFSLMPPSLVPLSLTR
jgi:hypothetical protein